MKDFIARSRKAVVGGVIAATGVVSAVSGVDNELVRYGAVAGAFLVGFAAVFFTPNEAPAEVSPLAGLGGSRQNFAIYATPGTDPAEVRRAEAEAARLHGGERL